MKRPKPAFEVIARALCWHDGHPQDIKFEGRPMWESYLDQANAVAAALKEAGLLEWEEEDETNLSDRAKG